MVERQVAGRGVLNEKVLDAMRNVPRELFLPAELREFAYEDSPLPIASGQTISQPYIVAFMVEALNLQGGEKVLEIGTGSGYAAAVLAQIAARVCTIERVAELANGARATLSRLGYDNVSVRHGDGTLGWPEEAPFDAIVVAAGGPDVPESLKRQVRAGGRIVIPVGQDKSIQELVRITRVSETEFRQEDLADVRFVPLVGEEGWAEVTESGERRRGSDGKRGDCRILAAIADDCEPFNSLEKANIGPVLERIGNARVVLIGEAGHGTSEFYRMRNRLTAELIMKKNFRFVAIEGDWPDAARIDHYVRHFDYPPSEWTAFARFPTWMWRNEEVREFVDWLRIHNSNVNPDRRTAFHGLDLYSLYSSIRAVLEYLDDVDPQAAALARHRYGCLTPWQTDPAVVWAHNSHVGDSAATEMSKRGELNIGHLCRQEFGSDVYAIGFGTDNGTVAAASDWDGPMEIKMVRPALPDSYEGLFHETTLPGFTLPLRGSPGHSRDELLEPRLQRAIGVIYRPESELASHYFRAVLPRQFDEYVWFDSTRAVTPIDTKELEGMPDTYPFGL